MRKHLKSAAIKRETLVREANIRLHKSIHADYNGRQAIYHPEVIAHLKRLTHPFLSGRSGAMLDAGCGTGYVKNLLSDYDFQYAGFDITSEMTSTAKKLYPAGLFSIGDVFAAPFKPDTFDLLTISGVLHHVVDYEKMLASLLVHVRKGGLVLILNEPNAAGYNLLRPLRFITSHIIPERRVKEKVLAGKISGDDEITAEYHLNEGKGVYPENVSRVLEHGGFRILKMDYTNLNIIANIGERADIDLMKTFPALKNLNTGRRSLEFNMIAEKPA